MAQAIASRQGEQALLEEIAADAEAQGAQHHRFVHDGKQIAVIAEWDTPESLQTFFTDNAKIAVTKDAGNQVLNQTAPPRIRPNSAENEE